MITIPKNPEPTSTSLPPLSHLAPRPKKKFAPSPLLPQNCRNLFNHYIVETMIVYCNLHKREDHLWSFTHTFSVFKIATISPHCEKSVQIRSLFWSVLSCIRSKSPYSIRVQENTDQKKLCIWTLFTQCP